MELLVYRGKLNGRDIYDFEPIRDPAKRDEGRGTRLVDWAERPTYRLEVPDGTQVCRGRASATAIMLPGREEPIDADDAIRLADELGLPMSPINRSGTPPR